MKAKAVLITGSSSGFGYELAKLFKKNGYEVVGISRSSSDLEINNIICDFTDLGKLREIEIPDLDYKYVILNAGVLGSIEKTCNITIDEYKEVFDINVFSNKILLDRLMKMEVENIIGISSGAAHKTYLGWSLYCMSKAAFKQLISSYSDEYTDNMFLSIAPGIMKTNMQDKIYNIDEKEFPSVKKFKELYDTNMSTPEELANKFLCNIDNLIESNLSGSFFDMRDIV